MKRRDLMFRKGIFFLILTGLSLCAGCAGRRPAEQGELVRMEAVGENPAVFLLYADVKKW